MEEKRILRIEVTETSRGREYWATRPWAQEVIADIRAGDIVLVPWENFREGQSALYPQGTGDIYKRVRDALADKKVVVGIAKTQYAEVALHGRAWRLPTFLVTVLVFPALAQVLGNRLDEWLSEAKPKDTVHLELIVEGPKGRCVAIKYEGPKDRLLYAVGDEVKRCFPPEPAAAAKAKDKKKSTKK